MGTRGVVLALDDHDRGVDLGGAREWGDLFEIRFHLGIALVTVFGAAEVAAVALGVLQEGDEVGDADDVDAGLDAIVVGRLDGERHEAAVGAADDADPGLVEVGLGGDPVKEGADVLDAESAREVAVVELLIGLAVARGPTDVGEDEREAELIDQVVEPGRGMPGGTGFRGRRGCR